MNYVLLIYESEQGFDWRKDPVEAPVYMGGWLAYSQALVDAGVFVSGAGLAGPDLATTMRSEGGRHLVQDGPYADTKEQLGGFFVINVPDLDTALRWAERCPTAPGSKVEIRPTLQMPG